MSESGWRQEDTSDRRAIADELLRADELREALVSSSPLPIVVLTATGNILLWNHAAENVFGWTAEEVLGGPLPFIPTERENEHRAMRAQDLSGQGFTGREIQRKRKDGMLIDLSVSTAPLRDKNKSVIGILSIYVDITERKSVENALAWQARELARSNADLQQFAHAVSHDLQEPLRAICSFTQLLAHRYRGSLDTDADEFLEHIISGTQRMSALIRDLLSYSQVMEAGSESEELVDLNAVLSDALRSLELTIRETGADIEYEALPSVEGYRVALGQLLLNLVSNGLKYRRPDAQPSIRIRSEQASQEWIFCVKDNGIGIDPRYHEKIFGIFQRVDSIRVPGAGIGLALCKKIVERHRGRIWVESALGQGATFFFTLPIFGSGGPSSADQRFSRSNFGGRDPRS